MDCSSGQINVLYSCTKSDKKKTCLKHFIFLWVQHCFEKSGFLNPCLLWLYLVVLCKIFVIVIYMILFVTSPAMKRDCSFVQGVYSSVKLRNSPSGFGLSESVMFTCTVLQLAFFSVFYFSPLPQSAYFFFFHIYFYSWIQCRCDHFDLWPFAVGVGRYDWDRWWLSTSNCQVLSKGELHDISKWTI